MMTPRRSVAMSMNPFFVRGDTLLDRVERHPIRLAAGCKSRRFKRAQGNRAATDGKPHRSMTLAVEVRVCVEEALLLGGARALAGKTVHVMMAISLRVREPEQARHREVLLHREPRLHG